MGFIDWLTKDNNIQVQEKEVESKDNEINNDEDTFNFEDEEITDLRELSNSERLETMEYQQDNDEEDFDYSPQIENNYYEPQINTSNSAPNASFTIFKVQDEEDVRLVLKHLSSNLPCIATFENVRKKDFNLVMKYMQGGVYVLGANMSEWQKDAYIMVPRGMTINMQEKHKRKR